MITQIQLNLLNCLSVSSCWRFHGKRLNDCFRNVKQIPILKDRQFNKNVHCHLPASPYLSWAAGRTESTHKFLFLFAICLTIGVTLKPAVPSEVGQAWMDLMWNKHVGTVLLFVMSHWFCRKRYSMCLDVFLFCAQVCGVMHKAWNVWISNCFNVCKETGDCLYCIRRSIPPVCILLSVGGQRQKCFSLM